MASHTLVKFSRSFGVMVCSAVSEQKSKKSSKGHEPKSMIFKREISSLLNLT